ncbi:MAG: ABC transporter ATP-binding protein [Methanoregula sp.]
MSLSETLPALSREWSSMRIIIVRAVRLVFKHTPGWTLLSLLLIFVMGLLPLAGLFVMKLMVDTVSAGIAATDKAPLVSYLALLIIIAATISIITVLFRALSSYATEVQSIRMSEVISDMIQSHSISLDLAYYENPEYFNTLHRAQLEGPTRPAKIVSDIVQVAQSCISLGAVGAVIITFSPLAGVVLVFAAIPAAALRLWYSRRFYELQQHQTESERKSSYYHRMMSGIYHAKEVRLFGLGPYFKETYRDLQEPLHRARLALLRSRVTLDIVAQGFITAAIFGSFAVIALMALEGTVTLGDMVVYFMAFQMCIGYVQSIFGNLGALYEDQLFLRNLFLFLDLQPGIAAPAHPVPLNKPLREGVQVENVTFTYAGAKAPALINVNLTLHPGEVIAFVGGNGAGKSTLVKLICRLYSPDTGKILADGQDLSEVSPEDWQSRLTVLFQDYVHYNMTVRENIWLADITRSYDSPDIARAAEKADVDAVINRFPHTYRTMLGHSFSGGQELSTGEWQKIALARAFFRNAEIVILDEPASSLDALAEAEIFRKFKEIVGGRSAILISHRFSTVLMADRIYVLDRGQVVEQGTHAELMSRNGWYATMFHAQADAYRESSS